jgi:uncharacterized MAPEG superfamily protein
VQSLSHELYWLTLTALATAVFWTPYILQMIVQLGPIRAMMETAGEETLDAMWARRAKRAHANAVENLAVFAPLVLAVHITGASTQATATACMIYFFVRVAHYLVYCAGIPVARTLLFVAGFICQVVLASAVLMP